MLEQFTHNNIINADETSLFFKCLPNCMLALTEGRKRHLPKGHKERITLLFTENMCSTEKLPEGLLNGYSTSIILERATYDQPIEKRLGLVFENEIKILTMNYRKKKKNAVSYIL